jgi:multiple sugar transport system permease protein
VLPVALFFAVFSVFPVFFGFYLSLTDYDLLNPPLFVGLDNFRNLLGDKLFLTALANTLIFVLGATVPVWVASLAAALLFDRAFRARDILKAIFFLPVLPPIAVVAVIWRLLLHPNGIATSTIGLFSGVSEIPWLANTVLAPFAMIVVHDWAAIPFFMLIWLAGLTGIPQDVRDAAAVDGAGALARFWHIELPLLRQTSLLVASLATINAFQSFALQFLLSSDQGGPANSTLVLGLLVFKYGFQYFRMGDAAAVSVVMFAMILSVTLLQLWLGRRARNA